MQEFLKPRPTRENWNEYKTMMKECKNLSEDAKTEAYLKADAYYAEFDWSCFPFEKNKLMGLKNPFGEVVIPAAYDEMLVYPSYTFIKSVAVIAKKEGKIGLIKLNEEGGYQEITPFIYSDAEHVKFTNLTSVKNSEGKWGLIDMDGRKRVPAEMDIIDDEDFNGCVYVWKGDKKGVYDTYCEGFAYPEYDDIDGQGEGGPLIFKKDGVEGQVDENGIFYPMSLIDSYYAGKEADRSDNSIFNGGQEPFFISDHLVD